MSISIEESLSHLLISRANGSEGLRRTADFIESVLLQHAPQVERQIFTATPYGFQIVWTAALLLALGYFVAMARRRWGLAIVFILAPALLLLVEFELLLSPLSGLASLPEENIVATFAGASDGPTLLLTAHYDSATHFGDHLIWHRWGRSLAPATLLALVLALIGRRLESRGGGWLRRLVLPASALMVVPYVALFTFFAIGTWVRAPSPGAIDNGGSVAVLLDLAQGLALRPADAPTTVKLVFFAAEEERALGSWHFAAELARTPRSPVAVINLEGLGAGQELGCAPQDGFELRRYASPPALLALLDESSRQLRGRPLARVELPPGVLTDARSFLARGIPATTLRPAPPEGFPRRLHSVNDSRERLSVAALEEASWFLRGVVARVDREPSVLGRI